MTLERRSRRDSYLHRFRHEVVEHEAPAEGDRIGARLGVTVQRLLQTARAARVEMDADRLERRRQLRQFGGLRRRVHSEHGNVRERPVNLLGDAHVREQHELLDEPVRVLHLVHAEADGRASGPVHAEREPRQIDAQRTLVHALLSQHAGQLLQREDRLAHVGQTVPAFQLRPVDLAVLLAFDHALNRRPDVNQHRPDIVYSTDSTYLSVVVAEFHARFDDGAAEPLVEDLAFVVDGPLDAEREPVLAGVQRAHVLAQHGRQHWYHLRGRPGYRTMPSLIRDEE